MLTLVMMPPQNDLQRQWAPRLQRSLPDYRVVVPETDAEACRELIDADAAYGWVPPDALPYSQNIRTRFPTGGYTPYHRPHFGLSSAPLSPILTVNMDGTGCGGEAMDWK